MGWVINVTPRPLYLRGKTRYPLCRRLGGPQGRSGRVRKILPPPGFDPRIVQPVASHYTDCAIPASSILKDNIKLRTEFPSIEFCLEVDLLEGGRLKDKVNHREMSRWGPKT